MTSPTPPEPSEAVGDVIGSRTVREVERENTMFLQDLSRPGNAAKTTKERTLPESLDPPFKGTGGPRWPFVFDLDDIESLEDSGRPRNAAKTTEERTRPHLFHHYNESIDKAALSNGRMRNLMMGRGRACDDCRWNKIRCFHSTSEDPAPVIGLPKDPTSQTGVEDNENQIPSSPRQKLYTSIPKATKRLTEFGIAEIRRLRLGPEPQGDKILQSVVNSGYHTGTKLGSDTKPPAGSVGLPNEARDEFISFVAKSMYEHVGSWVKAAARTCPADYLLEALNRHLEQYAVDMKADAKIGLQEQSALMIQELRPQIARALTKSFDSQANDSGTFHSLHKFLRQNSLKKRPIILSRGGAMPNSATVEEKGISGDEETPDISIELSSIKSFLTSSLAFIKFRDDLKTQTYYSTGGMMETINIKVLENIDLTSPVIDAQLIVCGWDIREFLKDQYERGHELGQVLLITGTLRQAYVVPCVMYMKDIWPRSGPSTLAALEIALREGIYERKGSTGPIKSIELSSKEAVYSAAITIHGTPTDIVEIMQQFSLLATCLRPPRCGMLCKSEASIEYTSRSQYRLNLLDLQPASEVEKSCWHPLFHGSVVALGFPTPPRTGQIGIEIPYSLMTALARILYPVEFHGGIILKGFSTMLVPTGCASDSIQWHFISNEGNKRLPTVSVRDRIGTWCKIKDYESIRDKRAFVGFCAKVKVLLGSRDADYDSIGYSTYAKRTGRRIEITGGTAGFAATTHGLPGPTLGLNFVLSRNQAMTRSLVNEDYVNMLEEMKERPLILYDVDVKKSWLVSTMSAVLHMIHIWARRYPALIQFKGSPAELPFAEASWDGGSAALKAIFEEDKSLLELHVVPGVEPYTYRLKDLVKKLWGNLESAIDALEDQKPVGIRLARRRTIRGWELMDMVIAKPLSRPKEHRVEGTSGGWQFLTDDVMTLFCSGLGDIIIPGSRQQFCPGWSPLPSMKDYMLASVPALGCLAGTCGKVRDGYVRLTDKLCLLQRSSCYLAANCSHGSNERCDVLQEIKVIQKKWLPHPLEMPHTNGLPLQGAVVIGKAPKFVAFWDTNTSSVAHEKSQASKADQTSTCEAERSQSRLSLNGELNGIAAWIDLGLENGAPKMNDTGNASHPGTTGHNIDTGLVLQDERTVM